MAIAITEEHAGSDLHGLRTTYERMERGYRVDGEKMYVSRLRDATDVLVFASCKRNSEHSLSTFLIPLESPSIIVTDLHPIGLGGTSWGCIHFTDVRVPFEKLIGGEGQGFSLFQSHFKYWRIMMAAAAVGGACRALQACIKTVGTRTAFGGAIGRFTHIQQELARSAGAIRMAWLLILDTARRYDGGGASVADVCMAKAESVEISLEVAECAMKTLGAAGYRDENDVARCYRDLLGLRIADGTTDVLRSQVARRILGADLYEMGLGRRSSYRTNKASALPTGRIATGGTAGF